MIKQTEEKYKELTLDRMNRIVRLFTLNLEKRQKLPLKKTCIPLIYDRILLFWPVHSYTI